ncbi:polyprenyl diphosphate synthase [Candidatus Palauibacter sp.]|uniref:polyprenyl diphosphate synthase n=1 Tax=Candidatus Palauibacter sp. TaxID=3101350 RepID=UPI003B5C6494
MSGLRDGATSSLEVVRQGEVPTHVAIIMDGNGRWARRRGLPRWEGHRAGMTAVREAIEGAAEAGVSHLTLYAFSDENWSRPPSEVDALMALLEEYVRSQREALTRHSIRVTVFGDRMRLPQAARDAIGELELSTAGGAALHVHLAISYGSRAEIVSVARTLARRCARGKLSPEAIDAECFAGELLTRDWPDPDLLIRTSGEQRISNFLLWQLAYAEIFVTDVLWPDFTREHLFGAVVDYRGRERRFGLVKT